MKSEKEKMLAGELYISSDPQLVAERARARSLTKAFNDSHPNDGEARERILTELFGARGASVFIEPPFFCDYGSNIFLGDNVFMNFNCVILDVNVVRIGE